MREMGFVGVSPVDGRRLEVVATGLPLHNGVPLGLDATIVSPLHMNGTPWPRAATQNGVALARAEAAKKRTYPEMVDSPVVRLVTIGIETGGRCSETTLDLLRRMAAARARSAPRVLQRAVSAGWAARWSSLLSVVVQDSLAATLVDDSVLLLDGGDVGSAPCDADVWANDVFLR